MDKLLAASHFRELTESLESLHLTTAVTSSHHEAFQFQGRHTAKRHTTP